VISTAFEFLLADAGGATTALRESARALAVRPTNPRWTRQARVKSRSLEEVIVQSIEVS
jgi:hypothetical protein